MLRFVTANVKSYLSIMCYLSHKEIVVYDINIAVFGATAHRVRKNVNSTRALVDDRRLALTTAKYICAYEFSVCFHFWNGKIYLHFKVKQKF